VETRIDPKQVECAAWDYLDHLITLMADREYDSDYPELKRSLGYDYSGRLGALVADRAEKLWVELMQNHSEEKCYD
jgi:hypothetical protein